MPKTKKAKSSAISTVKKCCFCAITSIIFGKIHSVLINEPLAAISSNFRLTNLKSLMIIFVLTFYLLKSEKPGLLDSQFTLEYPNVVSGYIVMLRISGITNTIL